MKNQKFVALTQEKLVDITGGYTVPVGREPIGPLPPQLTNPYGWWKTPGYWLGEAKTVDNRRKNRNP